MPLERLQRSAEKGSSKEAETILPPKCLKIHCKYIAWLQPAVDSFHIQLFSALPGSQITFSSSLCMTGNREDVFYSAASSQHGGTLRSPEHPYENNEQVLLHWTYLLLFVWVSVLQQGPLGQSESPCW